MYKLVITDDEGKISIVPLAESEITIGRKEGNTILLSERNVSRHHAKIVRGDDGFVLQDLSSLCGTKIAGRLLRGKSAAVQVGDQIQIGDYTATIQSGSVSHMQTESSQSEQGRAATGKVTPYARLVLLTEPNPGRETDLSGELYMIGRSTEANCQILHASVSRAHARLDCEDGRWFISDLGSISGVLINGTLRDNYQLRSGDTIELGSVRLRFVDAGVPYDFDPVHDEGSERNGDRGRSQHALQTNILYALGAVGVLVALGLVAMILQGEPADPPGGSEQAGTAGSANIEIYDGQGEIGVDSGVH